MKRYGYTSEVHKIKTKGGYKQEIHRISGSPKSPPAEGKKVVFLMHGIEIFDPFIIPLLNTIILLTSGDGFKMISAHKRNHK